MRYGVQSVLGAAVALSLGGAYVAEAQETGDTVVVTGQRQAYRNDVALNDTPQAVTVLDSATLEQAGVQRLSEALDLSASMARQNNFGGLWDAFAIRGFAGDENLPSGYLVNGFNAGRGFGGPRDVSGIERIEILRGPNAALFGRGEPGGSINIVTKRPEATHKGTFSVSAGSFDTYRADADLNLPLNDMLATRITGFYEDAGSFRDTLETNRYGIAPSVLLRVSDATTLSYELELTRQEIPFDRGVVAVNGVLGLVPESRFLGEPSDGPLTADATGHQLQLQHDLSDDWSVLLGAGYRETDLQGFSTEAELAASRQRLNVDGQSLSRQRRFRDYEAEHTVLRAELSGKFETVGISHRILLGVDNDAFDNSQLFLRFRPPALSTNPTAAQGNVIDIFQPVYGQFPLPTPGPLTNRLDEQRAWGLYVQDHIVLNDSLQIRVGGRYDDFSLDGLNRANNTRTSSDETRFSPQVGVVFKPIDILSLYANYGEGFRQNLGADAGGNPFSAEESKSGEIGAKVELMDGALTGTFAYYAMEKTNVLTADPLNAGFSIALGEAKSEGFELDVAGRLPGELDVIFSYATTDATVGKDALEPNFSLAIREGDRLINIPDQTASLLVSRDFAVADQDFTVGGGVLHVGDRLGETGTTFELPSYTLVRAFAIWSPSPAFELAGEVNNLLDETYYTNSFARLWVAPGAPQNASVTLRYRY